jgi:arsenical pump membrane protein
MNLVARIAPVLVFLIAVTVIAELADKAKLFEVAAREGRSPGSRPGLAAVDPRRRTRDRTHHRAVPGHLRGAADPVVLAMARQLDIPPKLFAFTTVWLAGTASLLLPVSNLTNLLALHQFRRLDASYLAVSWRPAIAAILITVAVLAVLFHRDLRRTYVVPPTPEVDDKVLFWGSAGVCVLLGPAFVSGIEVAWPASVGAIILVVLFAVRRRSALRWSLIPAKLVIGVVVLFTFVAFLTDHGLEDLLRWVAGDHLGPAAQRDLGRRGEPVQQPPGLPGDGTGRLERPASDDGAADRCELWLPPDPLGLARDAALAGPL